MIYVDTSFLATLLVNDSNSKRALETVKNFKRPLAFNRLLKLEIGNALVLNHAAEKLSEREISVAELMIDDLIGANR